jgi:hypothetical protein
MSKYENLKTGSLSAERFYVGTGNGLLGIEITSYLLALAAATPLASNLAGDVYAANGTSKILDNGTNGTNAALTGRVLAVNGDSIIYSAADGVGSSPGSKGDSAMVARRVYASSTAGLTSLVIAGTALGTPPDAIAYLDRINKLTFWGVDASALNVLDDIVSFTASRNSFGVGLLTADQEFTLAGGVNIVGDVYAANGTSKILENGTNGTDGFIRLDTARHEKINCQLQGDTYAGGANGAINGGLKRIAVYASALVTNTPTFTIDFSIPVGARLLGVQLVVESALAGGDLWDAEWNDGATLQAIATAKAVAANTKANSMYSAIQTVLDADTNIVITKNGGGAFTVQGRIGAVAYYEWFEDLANA